MHCQLVFARPLASAYTFSKNWDQYNVSKWFGLPSFVRSKRRVGQIIQLPGF